ncbi:harmonin-like isoform X1 [Daphnia carinata]|uniref:harmonin-like isoform X1 n=1 Tax=Daphnia carinata TaxID=120202 RepID=UPI002868B801|nr:harmonin-like isoform X1 [Daphnia carinata]
MDIYSDADDNVPLKPTKLRTIRLNRRPGVPYFGFGIRGGREYGLGFFVTKVVAGSESELQGLSVGDQVIRIDGMRVEEALHREMLNFIRSKSHITLSVRSGGLVPFYECTNHALSWQPVKTDRVHHPALSASSSWSPTEVAPSFASLTLRSHNKGRFGCSVCEGPPHRRGVYIQSTEEGSVARVAGIKAGDRILHCNGMDMTSVDFDEAVMMLKESNVLNLIISRGAGSDFISPGESSGYNSAASSVNGDQSPLQNGKQKRLSVVREEMIDVVDERRGIVVGSATVDFCHRNGMNWNVHETCGKEPIHQAVQQWNRSSIVLEEQEERKRLQEERRRIQEAHKLLAEEKEKLARDRQQLEDARFQLLNGSAPSLKTMQPTTKPYAEPETVVKAPVGGTVHEQLMVEFKQKMVSLKATDVTSGCGQEVSQVGKVKEISASNTHLPLKASQSAPPAPPLPPPLPTGVTVAARKKPAPPPPVPVPDYDLSSFSRKMDNTEQEVRDDTTLMSKLDKPSSVVRVSIGTYQELPPEPTKLDFLPSKRHSTSPAGTRQPDGVMKNQLQSELSQTLSRSRLRQRIPSTDLELSEEIKSKSPAEVNPPIASKEESPIEKNRPAAQQPPALSTFRRAPASEIQAKMASLAAASANGLGRDATISQLADNKVTIKVHPYVSRSDFGQTTYIDSVPVTEL